MREARTIILASVPLVGYVPDFEKTVDEIANAV